MASLRHGFHIQGCSLEKSSYLHSGDTGSLCGNPAVVGELSPEPCGASLVTDVSGSLSVFRSARGQMDSDRKTRLEKSKDRFEQLFLQHRIFCSGRTTNKTRER